MIDAEYVGATFDTVSAAPIVVDDYKAGLECKLRKREILLLAIDNPLGFQVIDNARFDAHDIHDTKHSNLNYDKVEYGVSPVAPGLAANPPTLLETSITQASVETLTRLVESQCDVVTVEAARMELMYREAEAATDAELLGDVATEYGDDGDCDKHVMYYGDNYPVKAIDPYACMQTVPAGAGAQQATLFFGGGDSDDDDDYSDNDDDDDDDEDDDDDDDNDDVNGDDGLYTYQRPDLDARRDTYPAYYTAWLAFNHHYNYVLSVEHLHVLIVQGVAQHIKYHTKELENVFIAPQHLSVLVDSQPRDNTTFTAFLQGLTPAFDTAVSGPLLKQLRQPYSNSSQTMTNLFTVATMDMVSSYVTFSSQTLCGIPKIKVMGSTADWETLIQNVQALKAVFSVTTVPLDGWLDLVLPVLDKIKTGGNPEFWASFFRHQSKSGVDYNNGWFNVFLPYRQQVPIWESVAAAQANNDVECNMPRYQVVDSVTYIRFNDQGLEDKALCGTGKVMYTECNPGVEDVTRDIIYGDLVTLARVDSVGQTTVMPGLGYLIM